MRNWHRPAMRFEDFIERTSTTLKRRASRENAIRASPSYLSMIMLEFDETLVPGRRRERVPIQAMARVARLLPTPPD